MVTFPDYLPADGTKMYPAPVGYVVRTVPYKAGTHEGVDLGWSAKILGANQPIYSIAAGTVITVIDGYDNYYPTRGYGNYCIVDHGGKLYSLYAHIHKGSFAVKKGDTVEQGRQLALMGNSGNSTGNHLHFEIRKGGSTSAYRVNPEPYIHLYDADRTTEATSKLFTHVRGLPIRNEEKTQLYVYADWLRCRAEPSLTGEVLGYMAQGYYGFTETAEAGGYKWYKIAGEYWAAASDGYSRLVDAEETEIEKLRKENAALLAANTRLEAAITGAISTLEGA